MVDDRAEAPFAAVRPVAGRTQCRALASLEHAVDRLDLPPLPVRRLVEPLTHPSPPIATGRLVRPSADQRRDQRAAAQTRAREYVQGLAVIAGVGQDGDDAAIVGLEESLQNRTDKQLRLGEAFGAAAVGIFGQRLRGHRPGNHRNLPWRPAGGAHPAWYSHHKTEVQVQLIQILVRFSTEREEALSPAPAAARVARTVVPFAHHKSQSIRPCSSRRICRRSRIRSSSPSRR